MTERRVHRTSFKDQQSAAGILNAAPKPRAVHRVPPQLLTWTWSSSVTGSEVLVDLSAIRFFLVAARGLVLEKSGEQEGQVEESAKRNQFIILAKSEPYCPIKCVVYVDI